MIGFLSGEGSWCPFRKAYISNMLPLFPPLNKLNVVSYIHPVMPPKEGRGVLPPLSWPNFL